MKIIKANVVRKASSAGFFFSSIPSEESLESNAEISYEILNNGDVKIMEIKIEGMPIDIFSLPQETLDSLKKEAVEHNKKRA